MIDRVKKVFSGENVGRMNLLDLALLSTYVIMDISLGTGGYIIGSAILNSVNDRRATLNRNKTESKIRSKLDRKRGVDLLALQTGTIIRSLQKL